MAPPTLYQYYTIGAISQGLSASQPTFTLNNKNITIYSGALHYFRVPPAYWRDRLRKMRAAGLNTVETYVPWNLHEPEPGNYDFGKGSSDFTEFLDVEKFMRIAREEDLFVIARPGPYICTEWEFGGLPSWLLRSNVKGYWRPCSLAKGGPIIAFQIENEYGNTKIEGEPIDTQYLESLKDILRKNGIVELLFTSDTPSNGFSGTLPGILATANFQEKPIEELSLLKEYQPDKPLMVMEYWTGWFDHWSEKHHQRTAKAFGDVLDKILGFNSSVNMYMFHGGTNWGLLNGANIKDLSTNNSAYQPDTTSYDYDAPLSEIGDYTDKYRKVKELIAKHNKIVTKLPEEPKPMKRQAYPSVQIKEMLTFDDLVKETNLVLTSDKPIPMELLDINNQSGQSYGYLVYRQENLNIDANSILKIEGHVCDTVMVLINGELKSPVLKSQKDLDAFGYWRLNNSTLDLGPEVYSNATLDLVVENWGRSNYGKLNQFNQFKGLWQGDVLLDNVVLRNWKLIPLEFRKKWTNSLENWKKVEAKVGPTLYRATLEIDEPIDTFIDMRGWNKGIVMVNGFVLARYLRLGPQQTAYLPGPFLKKGPNSIVIFEHFNPSCSVKFVKEPIFETLS